MRSIRDKEAARNALNTFRGLVGPLLSEFQKKVKLDRNDLKTGLTNRHEMEQAVHAVRLALQDMGIASGAPAL